MDTKLFKTRTIIQSQTVNGQRAAIRKNPSRKPDQWVIGLDIGYSSVKGMSQNSLFTFPKFAKKWQKKCFLLSQQAIMILPYLEEIIIIVKSLKLFPE